MGRGGPAGGTWRGGGGGRSFPGMEGGGGGGYGTARGPPGGRRVISRVDFARGRVRPQLAVNASAGVEVHRSDRVHVSLQVDGTNLNDRLNLINFGGLFSGNAIGPARSFAARLNASF